MKHFLNDIEVSPRNVLQFGLTSNFGGDPSILQIDADKIILPREGLQIIQNWIATQGLFEGIPYRIEMGNSISLEYYVDLTETAIIRDHEIEVKIKKRNAYDNFFDNANGTSFELMAEKGVVFPLIDIPYLIVKDDVLMSGLTIAISLYTMTDALVQSVKDLVTTASNIIEASTPNIGLPPAPPIGEIITLALKFVAQAVYTASLLVAVIKLAQQMFELLFPKVRYYKGATVKNLIQAGCTYLGYTLNSSLLNSISNLAIMPVPLIKEKKSVVDYIENDLNFAFTKGYPTAQDSTPTVGSLIDAVELMFNAHTRVFNGEVQIERRDFWSGNTPNNILPALNMQDDMQTEFEYNTDAIWKRLYIHYQVDYADFHTVDFFDPTDAEYNTEALNVINQDLVCIKGLNDVNIPFALGVRKNNLNWIEEFAKGFFNVVDNITGIFGGGTSFVSQITNRIGVTQIGQQFYSKTKILWQIGGKQPSNYVSLIGAKGLYDNYHYINQIQLNGYKIINDAPLRMTTADFVNLLYNNFAEINGTNCEIIKIRFNNETSKAVISYKIPFDYASGKVITTVIND
jgi:hypothetical protein